MRKLLCSLALFAAVGATVASAPPAPAQQKKDAKKESKRDDKKGTKEDASKVEVYQAKDGWRFRVAGPDGRTLAIGVQGFAKKDDCLAAVEALKATLNKVKATEKPKE
jgi:uncharacterized protein YegP (UPF0339 family)